MIKEEAGAVSRKEIVGVGLFLSGILVGAAFTFVAMDGQHRNELTRICDADEGKLIITPDHRYLCISPKTNTKWETTR